MVDLVDEFISEGTCIVSVKNDALNIRIKISSAKLGLVSHSGYIHEFDEKTFINFQEILAHELAHAKDNIAIVNKYGIDEFKLIKDDKVSKLARDILSEYIACREIAEQYNSFNTNVSINVSRAEQDIIIFFNGERALSPIKSIHNLNYAIATRVAHADVSQSEESHLHVSRPKEKQYISSIRSLLNKHYNQLPLNYSQYKELGNNMISEFMTIILGIDPNSVITYMPKILDD